MALHLPAWSGRHHPPAAALAAIVVAGALAGCGGSSHSSASSAASSSRTTTSGAAASPAETRAEIAKNWTAFFSASTPPSRRVALLQNGHQFASALATEAKSPLASQAQAKVSKVTLQGPNRALVTYTILVAGQPALTAQKGTAVKSDGTWQVADTSFCRLLGYLGAVPANCPKG